MISLKRKQSGFTIVELLIVIVVIGILAALVVTTFSGIQKKARDTERETDIKAVHGQLEAYYAQEGRYPTQDNMTDNAWIGENMRGLDLAALQDPKGGDELCTAAPAAGTWCYVYTSTGDDNYTLTAAKEGSDTPFTKSALN